MKAGHTQKKWTATKWTENCWGTEKEWIDFSRGDRKTLINSKMKSLFLVQQSPTYLLPYTQVNHVECKSFCGIVAYSHTTGIKYKIHFLLCPSHKCGHKAPWSWFDSVPPDQGCSFCPFPNWSTHWPIPTTACRLGVWEYRSELPVLQKLHSLGTSEQYFFKCWKYQC